MTRKKKEAGQPAAHTKTALIVDDLPAAREEMRYHVGALGHESIEAGCIAEARDKLRSEKVDYVLLDLQIPWEPDTLAQISFGEAFLHELVRATPDLPVVVVTGQGKTFAHHGRAVHAGPCVSFVTKPFDDEDPTCPHLTEEINRVFQKRRIWLEQRPTTVEPQVNRPAAVVSPVTIDVTPTGRYRHLQVFCALAGEEWKISHREHKILEMFERAQRAHPDPDTRHEVEVDVTSAFESSSSDDKYNVRHGAMSKFRTKIEEEIEGRFGPGHAPVLQPGDSKGSYRLGCFCVRSPESPTKK